MIKKNILLAFWIMASSVTFVSAAPRFYKANSVKIRYMYNYGEPYDMTSPKDIYVSPDYYATMWTGNDTIVDDRQCVTLWNQMDGEEPLCIGCIHEDANGYVWIKYLRSPYPKACPDEIFFFRNKWAFIYDFSNENMTWGDTYYEAMDGVPKEYVLKTKPVEVVLLNGEHTKAFHDFHCYGEYHFYGIGSSIIPFQTRNDTFRLFGEYLYGGQVLEYWRDGELLLNSELVTGMAHINLEPNEASPIYDLLGRPVTHPTKGIYIQNDKKVMIK